MPWWTCFRTCIFLCHATCEYQTSSSSRHLSLLELSGGPSAGNLLSGDRPDLSWGSGRSGDRAGDDVDCGAYRSLGLGKVSNLINVDLENGDSRVGWRSVVDAIALVGEPGFDGGVVQLLDERRVVAFPTGKSQDIPSRNNETTHLAFPAMETQPELLSIPSWFKLT